MSERTPISRADVEHVAALASLALTPDELERLPRDLNSILGYVAELNTLDTSGVEPLIHVSELFPKAEQAREAAESSRLRADEPAPSLDHAAVLATAPATDGTYFKVPKVIER